MMPGSPIQALLWKCWQRSWRQLLLVTLAVVVLQTLLLSMNVITAEIAERNTASRAFTLAGLFVIWAACPGFTYTMRSGMSGAGFALYEDFIRPIATAPLVFVPLTYLCLLGVVAYLVPTLVLWALLDLAPPSLTVVLLVVEGSILIIAAQWMTTNALLSAANWIALLLLAWANWIIPAALTTDADGTVIALPVSAYLKPAIVVAAVLVLLYHSVRTQRSSAASGGEGWRGVSPVANFRLANHLAFLRSDCPVTSGVRATLWRERQTRGIANHCVFGALMAVCALLTIYLLQQTIEMGSAIVATQVVGMAFAWFLVICIFTPLTMFDVSLGDRNPRISLFTRAQPIGTARLIALKVAVTVGGLLVSAAAMLLTILLLGPIFIADFHGIMGNHWQTLSGTWPYSFTETLARGFLLLAYFASIICIYAGAATWMFINSRRWLWYLAGIPAYALLLFLLLVAVSEPANIETLVIQVYIQHLWVLLIGLPLLTFYFLNHLLQDRVLTNPALAVLVGLAVVLWLLHVRFTLQENIFAPASSLVVAAGDTLQGFLPLFAAALVLWTFNRVRHG